MFYTSSLRIWHRLVLSATLVPVLAGCGGSTKPKAYPVSGKVSGASKSLEGVVIQFSPVATSGTHSHGTIKKDGTFDLMTLDGRSGAVPGKYKVVFAMGGQAAVQAMMSKPKMAAAGTDTSKVPKGMPMKNFGKSGQSMAPVFETPYPQSYTSPQTTPTEVEVQAKSNTLEIKIST